MKSMKLRKHLVYPVWISQDAAGRRVRKTAAFSLGGKDIPKKDLRSLQKERSKYAEFDPRTMPSYREEDARRIARRSLEEIVHDTKHVRHMIAQKSTFFIKRTNNRIKKIREILRKNWIIVEEPIMDLGDGTELFSRGTFRPLVRSVKNTYMQAPAMGQQLTLVPNTGRPGRYITTRLTRLRNPRNIADQIIHMVATMHRLGIMHGHLHTGNFAVGPYGERPYRIIEKVMLLDIDRAKQFKRKPKSKPAHYRQYKKDIEQLIETIHEIIPTYYGKEFREKVLSDYYSIALR